VDVSFYWAIDNTVFSLARENLSQTMVIETGLRRKTDCTLTYHILCHETPVAEFGANFRRSVL
jgi:hypothetical protein